MRLVRAVKPKQPYCPVCHRPHWPGPHVGSPDDWTPAATDEEADERAWELFFREFPSRGPHEVELIKSELLKIHRNSPGISGAEGVKRLGDVMRSRGSGSSAPPDQQPAGRQLELGGRD